VISPPWQISEADKTGLEMQDWLQMPSSRGSKQHCNGKKRGWINITKDFDVLCLLEGRRASSISSYISDGTPVPSYSCGQCNS
jgi:hypothetical protein